MPQKRISICTSRSRGSRLAIVVEASGDFSLAGLPYKEARGIFGQLISELEDSARHIKRILSDLKDFVRPGDKATEPFQLNYVVHRAAGNQGVAAGILGISRQALNKRLSRRRQADLLEKSFADGE